MNIDRSLPNKNKSFFISIKFVILQTVQPLFVLEKSTYIVLSTPIYYNMNLSFSDLWPTLTLEIPTICLLVLYMGKYKRFHKRGNLCESYPLETYTNHALSSLAIVLYFIGSSTCTLTSCIASCVCRCATFFVEDLHMYPRIWTLIEAFPTKTSPSLLA